VLFPWKETSCGSLAQGLLYMLWLEKKMVIKDERKKTLHTVSSLDVASQGKFVTFGLPRV
jgi:hypothetical protein